MLKVQIKTKAAKKIRRGYPLLLAEDLLEALPEDGWADFFAGKEKLGTGYVSKQNKGVGWLLPQGRDYQRLFEQAKALRSSFFRDELTTAFRLFNGEGDGLGGVTVDYYAGYAVFSWYNAFIYEQKAELIAAFRAVYPELIGAYEKIRFSGLDFESQQIYGGAAPEPLLVLENGVSYATYLNEGLMTGIFLDQKNVRGELSNGLVAGKTLLNMFSYTGAFSVAAAFGGAAQTTSVDLAKRSLDKTREQLAVNGIEPGSQRIYVMDVFGYFNYAKKKKLSYDCIVLDPPSFARNGKKTFSVLKNYGELVEQAVDILERDGILIASTNASNLSANKFEEMVKKALTKKAVAYEIFQKESLPADFHVSRTFPEGDYLKVLFIRLKS